MKDVERLTTAIGAAYDTTAPRRLLMPARLLVNRATRLRDASMLPMQRQRLLRCASETVLVIGWLRFNQDERIDAQAYFLLTEKMANEAPDDVMRARALGVVRGRKEITLPFSGGLEAPMESATVGVVRSRRAIACGESAVSGAAPHGCAGEGTLRSRVLEVVSPDRRFRRPALTILTASDA